MAECVAVAAASAAVTWLVCRRHELSQTSANEAAEALDASTAALLQATASCTEMEARLARTQKQLEESQVAGSTLTASLHGRVALVTGGSRGIGRAISLALANAGAAVAVNYCHRSKEAEEVVAIIRSAGGKACAIQADVSQSCQVTQMVATAESQFGPIDVLINSAGVAMKRCAEELTEAYFDTTIAVNLKSAFLCTQAVVPGMVKQKWGRIVNISSGAARGAGGVGVHYNASKAGMEGLTRGYAAQLAKQGITVNAVSPMLIDTEMIRDLGAEFLVDKIPVGRFGTVEECAQIVMMLMGNGYVTGQAIALNGGMSFQ